MEFQDTPVSNQTSERWLFIANSVAVDPYFLLLFPLILAFLFIVLRIMVNLDVL